MFQMGWNHQLVKNNQKYTPQCLGQFASPCIPLGRLTSRSMVFSLGRNWEPATVDSRADIKYLVPGQCTRCKSSISGLEESNGEAVALRGRFWVRIPPFFGLSWRWRKVFKNQTPDHRKIHVDSRFLAQCIYVSICMYICFLLLMIVV